MAATLEQSQVAHYLVSIGVVNPRQVLDEELVVTDVSRRNVVFVATTASGPTYVVKQPAGAEAVTTLAQEAAVLRGLAQTAISDVVPKVVEFDPVSARLLLRTPAAVPWPDGSGPPVRAAARLGRTLAALHALPADSAPVNTVDSLWGTSLPEPELAQVQDMSACGLDLLARIQGSQALCERLRTLRAQVRATAVTHGDLRWDNCLQRTAADGRRRSGLLVIDWELAGRGAAEADVGAAIAEYLRLWIGSIPIVSADDPARLARHGAHPLPRVQVGIRALWQAYQRASVRTVALARVTEFAAARLLQSAMESAQGLARVSAHAVTMVQVADHMLRDPDCAVKQLLGLRE